jgi:hypothetical protein
VEAILVATTDRYWDYPKPIVVTDSVLALMQDEFNRSDSLSLLFDEVSAANFKHLMKGERLIDYCWRHDLVGTLAALAVHSNPDVRIKAQQARLTRAGIGLLINDKKLRNGRRVEENRVSGRFFPEIMERTPHDIPGSENATIHDLYIRELMGNLDLLTGEFIFFGPDKQRRMGNPAEVSKAMLRWHAKLYPGK